MPYEASRQDGNRRHHLLFAFAPISLHPVLVQACPFQTEKKLALVSNTFWATTKFFMITLIISTSLVTEPEGVSRFYSS